MRLRNKKTEVSLHYFTGKNLGDSLNETLIEDLFHIKVSYAPFSNSELISIGSILDRLIKGSRVNGKEYLKQQEEADADAVIQVWGTGLMFEYTDLSGLSFVRPVKIHAVRGELTRQTIEKLMGKPLKCALGDPALLAPYVLSEKPEKQYTLGIIPHVAEYGMQEYARIQEKVDGSVIIDMTGEPVEVMRQIAACECVISTSLHGLIVADAFGVPSKWCELTNKILGRGYKYRDYYSGYGLKEEAFDLRDGAFPAPAEIKADYRVKPEAVRNLQLQLVRSFPYQNQYTKQLIKEIKKQK